MPYIKLVDRFRILDKLPTEDKDNVVIRSTGDLNYAITKLCQAYINKTGLSYTTLNGTIGVLECCKLELYRRMIAPYEDKKILENGDVY